MERRVVVTGLGAVTPLGLSIDTIWKKLCQGVSGIGKITRLTRTSIRPRLRGEVRDFTPEHYIDKRDPAPHGSLRPFCPGSDSRSHARSGSDLLPGEHGGPRRRVYWYGFWWAGILEAVHRTLLEGRPQPRLPLFPAMVLGNLASGHVSMRFGATGPNNSNVHSLRCWGTLHW